MTTVDPWIRSDVSGSDEPEAAIASNMPFTRFCGVLMDLPSKSSPVSSSKPTTSVKVPPISTVMRIIQPLSVAARLDDLSLDMSHEGGGGCLGLHSSRALMLRRFQPL